MTHNFQAKESATSTGTVAIMPEPLDEIIYEAKLVKTALGSSLPMSWSAEADSGLDVERLGDEQSDISGNSSNEKIDSVAAAGFEMVELLILAAEILKDCTTKSGS